MKVIDSDKEKLQTLLKEYETIKDMLNEELSGKDHATIYTDLVNLILRISDYFLKSTKHLKKGVADVMGGKVLQLESERLRAEGEARMVKLIRLLLEQGKNEEIAKITSDAKLREEYYTLYNIP
ncbi:MAG: hypothetical protein J6A77_00635 [Lachnospiraceae bacterium]|nr:hypothetical protein [Lachnospiraceae bacterium]